MNSTETPRPVIATTGVPEPAERAPDLRQFSPPQSAVALAYGEDDDTPRVVAKGRGLVAQTIIERARQHGVYVHESRELVALLMQLDLDERIPPQLYRAVAELLAWVYRLEKNQFSPAITVVDAGADLRR